MKSKKKRLVFFLPNFGEGGAAESILKLSKFLVKKNFSILIISIGKNSYKKDFAKINCELVEINSSRTIFAIFKIRKVMLNEIRKNHSKIIFISNIHYANIISVFSLINLNKIKLILTERSSISELNYSNNFVNNLKNKVTYYLAKNLYKFSDLVITNSKFEKIFIKKKFQLKKIICIHPPSIQNILKYKKKVQSNYKKQNIIYVGRLANEKGVFTILKALVKIKKKYHFTFTLFGNGPIEEAIKKFINDNNLEKNVILKGFIKSKKLIFKKANLFINASLWEGLPNALVQSINHSVFPICSDAPGGNIEVINNGNLGMSFKTGDHKDLENKIKFFFRYKLRLNDKKRRIHLKNYTEKKSNQKYLKTLNEI